MWIIYQIEHQTSSNKPMKNVFYLQVFVNFSQNDSCITCLLCHTAKVMLVSIPVCGCACVWHTIFQWNLLDWPKQHRSGLIWMALLMAYQDIFSLCDFQAHIYKCERHTCTKLDFHLHSYVFSWLPWNTQTSLNNYNDGHVHYLFASPTTMQPV